MRAYLVNNPFGIAFLRIIDACLPDCRRNGRVELPSSILVSNLAHSGDAVISTSILRMLKEAAPEIKIGVLCGSWNKAVFEKHPCVDWVHHVDHWKLNRSQISRWEKGQIYRSHFCRALKEIRQIHYGAAVDLYPYFPNSISLLWRAEIPVRIGFESGGFGPLLTHSLPIVDLNRSAAENFQDLVRTFFSLEAQSMLRPLLMAAGQLDSNLLEKGYTVFHMGSGNELKEWPEEKWRQLTEVVAGRGEKVVFTGRGTKEKERIQRVTEGLPNVVDLCDLLDWDGFVKVMSRARTLVSVDSVSIHVASAFEVPSVVLFSGISPISFWKPTSYQCRGLMKALPCAPCHLRQGCDSMACIREISVEEVVQEFDKLHS
jgi:ADP-heptose:LPS heptosyltransferase